METRAVGWGETQKGAGLVRIIARIERILEGEPDLLFDLAHRAGKVEPTSGVASPRFGWGATVRHIGSLHRHLAADPRALG